MEIKEYDLIKTKDGREGTVVLLYTKPRKAYEVEFIDSQGETETVEPEQIEKIISASK